MEPNFPYIKQNHHLTVYFQIHLPMRNVIFSNVKQSLSSVRFYIAAMTITAIIFVSSVETIIVAFRSSNLLVNGFHTTLILNALTSDAISFFTPIVCALPMSASFIEDVKNNFSRYYIYRSSRFSYILGRSVGCFISGGLVLFWGILIAYIIAALLFMPIEKAVGDVPALGLRDVVTRGIIFFVSGGFWALLGLTLSTFMESKYIAYASPFITFYLLLIVYERYFNNLFVISPKEWLNPSESWIYGEWSAALLILELTIIVFLIFTANAYRRLTRL